jgi:DNA primase
MVNFKELKQRVDITNVVDFLSLELAHKGEQLRGPCPRCKDGGDRALVITPERNIFYCFAAKQGGDQLSLAAHILDKPVKEAAQQIADYFEEDTTSPTVPEKPQGEDEKGDRTLQPLGYLQIDEQVMSLIGEEQARKIGIGYAGKGIMRGCIAFPIRTEDGVLVGYVGYDLKAKEMRVPPRGFRI